MRVDESVLPGVGRKFTITTQSGDCLVVVIHHSGRREVQTYEGPEADEPLYALDLTDQEARQLGAILGGVLFQSEVAELVGQVAVLLALVSIPLGALLFRYGPELMRCRRADVHPNGVALDC